MNSIEIKREIKELEQLVNKETNINSIEFLKACIEEKKQELNKLNSDKEAVKKIFEYLEESINTVNINGNFITKEDNKYYCEFMSLGQGYIKETTTKKSIEAMLKNNDYKYTLA